MLYKESCSQIEPMYKQLQDAIYEGDHFEALYEDQLPHHRHASEAFYVSDVPSTCQNYHLACIYV